MTTPTETTATAAAAWPRDLILGLLVAAGILLGGYERLQEHDARLKAEAQSAVQQKTIDQAKQDAQATQQNLDARLKTLEAQKQQPVTAPQFVLDLSKAIPALPQPVQVVQPPPTQQTVNGKTEELPSAPVVQIPAADLPSLRDYSVTCQETSAKLDACALTQADTSAELKATAAQRDEWEKTAKGGTWWRRTLTAAKWVVIGAGVGYLAAKR